MSDEDIIERLDDLIDIALEIRELKRKQLQLESTLAMPKTISEVDNVSSVVTHMHCGCHVGACHLCGEKSMTIPSPAARPSAEAEQDAVYVEKDTPHAQVEGRIPGLDKPFFCERCQIRTYKQHIHTEIP